MCICSWKTSKSCLEADFEKFARLLSSLFNLNSQRITKRDVYFVTFQTVWCPYLSCSNKGLFQDVIDHLKQNHQIKFFDDAIAIKVTRYLGTMFLYDGLVCFPKIIKISNGLNFCLYILSSPEQSIMPIPCQLLERMETNSPTMTIPKPQTKSPVKSLTGSLFS